MSLLLKEDGWKRFLIHWDVWVTLIAICALIWCLQTLKPTGINHVDIAFDWLSVISGVCMILAVIDAVCAADDYYRTAVDMGMSSSFITQVYIYRRSHGYKMTVVNTNNNQGYRSVKKNKLQIWNYKILKYSDVVFVLYTINDENYWYCLDPSITGEIKLGKKIDETLFWKKNGQASKDIIQILNDDDVTGFEAEKSFFDGVEVIGEIPEDEVLADRYIVLKVDDLYRVIGLYFKNQKERPHYKIEMNLNFRLKDKDITLIAQKGYHLPE